MLVASGPMAGAFCRWASALGEAACELDGGLPAGLSLLHLPAEDLLASPAAPTLRGHVDAARRAGALISLDLGGPEWIARFGAAQAAYHLATGAPDILFAGQASADELGAPLEPIATVPVIQTGPNEWAVYGVRVYGPKGGVADPVRFAAIFCVALLEGGSPVEAAGRAALASSLRLAETEAQTG